MGTMNKLVFSGDKEKIDIELHDESSFVQYAINGVDEAFGTLDIMAHCLAADMEGKGIAYAPDYEIVCEGVCADLLDKFKESQLRAIVKVLYDGFLPSDLDVLAQELQMRMR
ncbi:MAG: hypothetical protein IJ131_01000 [Eggerthellaceae bacterium]|nr:hypothetical protein [Eggerthellaceae bacterium]